MDIRSLRSFMAVAREGSLTKASNYLHVTQPALSRQLHELEHELGTKLFDRRSRGMELTEDGALLRDRARAILELTDRTEAEFKTRREGVGGTVCIGAAETDQVRYLARVAKAVREQNHRVTFELYSGNEEYIVSLLDRGSVDFGMLLEPADFSRFKHLSLPRQDTWGLLMRKDDPLAAKASIRVEDLRGVPLLVSRQATQRSLSSNVFTDWFGDAYDDLEIVATCDLFSNPARFVEEGIGCAFSVERYIGLDPDRNLTFRPMEPPVRPRINVLWKADRTFSPAAALFLEELRRAFEAADGTASSAG